MLHILFSFTFIRSSILEHTLNFWIPDDRANEFQGLRSSFLHLHMRVTQNFN